MSVQRKAIVGAHNKLMVMILIVALGGCEAMAAYRALDPGTRWVDAAEVVVVVLDGVVDDLALAVPVAGVPMALSLELAGAGSETFHPLVSGEIALRRAFVY